jgi:hypothetical protein
VIDLDELRSECVATDLAVSEADFVDLVAKATGSSAALLRSLRLCCDTWSHVRRTRRRH